MPSNIIKTMRVLSNKYSYELLSFLKDNPKRFKEIAKICPNEKMRAQRLLEFEQLGLIEVKVERIGRRATSLYLLSDKGKRIFELINKME